jgi:hypothetical protein
VKTAFWATAISLLAITNRDVMAENGIGENYPQLRLYEGRLALYCDGNQKQEAGLYREFLDARGSLVGKQSRVVNGQVEEPRWIFSPQTQTINEATGQHYKVNSQLSHLDRILKIGDSTIGITWEVEHAKLFGSWDHLSFVRIDSSSGEVHQARIGRTISWSEPNASEIIPINGEFYVAWTRTLEIDRDEAMRRGDKHSSLIADLVISRWNTRSNVVEHAVVERDLPGLARLSIARQRDQIVIARDGDPPKIRIKVVKLSKLNFAPDTN